MQEDDSKSGSAENSSNPMERCDGSQSSNSNSELSKPSSIADSTEAEPSLRAASSARRPTRSRKRSKKCIENDESMMELSVTKRKRRETRKKTESDSFSSEDNTPTCGMACGPSREEDDDDDENIAMLLTSLASDKRVTSYQHQQNQATDDDDESDSELRLTHLSSITSRPPLPRPLPKTMRRRPLPTAKLRNSTPTKRTPLRPRYSTPTDTNHSASINTSSAVATALINSSQYLAYSWASLRLGKELGTAALNDFLGKKTDKDTTKVTAQDALQIMNTLRVKTCMPPRNSEVHKVIKKSRFENKLSSETANTTAAPSDSTELLLPMQTLNDLYETMAAQDADDGSYMRREAHYLSAEACVDKLRGMENTICRLNLSQSQVLRRAGGLGLTPIDFSRFAGYGTKKTSQGDHSSFGDLDENS